MRHTRFFGTRSRDFHFIIILIRFEGAFYCATTSKTFVCFSIGFFASSNQFLSLPPFCALSFSSSGRRFCISLAFDLAFEHFSFVFLALFVRNSSRSHLNGLVSLHSVSTEHCSRFWRQTMEFLEGWWVASDFI